MAKGAVGLVALLLLIYGGIKAYPLIRGPFIAVDSPANYTSSADGKITLSGVAHNTEALYLDGGPLLIDPSGSFSTTLLLPPGGAILTLTATDRFGRTATERRTVYIP